MTDLGRSLIRKRPLEPTLHSTPVHKQMRMSALSWRRRRRRSLRASMSVQISKESTFSDSQRPLLLGKVGIQMFFTILI